eukprot:366065-Chlamydomonas_euryale.AAC.2
MDACTAREHGTGMDACTSHEHGTGSHVRQRRLQLGAVPRRAAHGRSRVVQDVVDEEEARNLRVGGDAGSQGVVCVGGGREGAIGKKWLCSMESR